MRLLLSLLAIFVTAVASAAPSGDGIFALVETNHGSFTCELFYEQAPMTVANFIGLAEGSRGWLDYETGLMQRKPFYDGLTFHRTIPNFMIQGGSPNGQGTDGPGYQFPDEFHPDLVHAEAGMLSMANSGFDSNGSQFFVTVGPTSWLNYKHAVFGEVIEGMEVVEAISEVSTLPGDRPEEPVIIHSVEIIRNGDAAEAFDVEGYNLPVVSRASARVELGTEGVSVRFPREAESTYTLAYSSDLENWTPASATLSGSVGEDAAFDVSALATGEERQFYQVAQVDRARVVPESLVGKTLELDAISSVGALFVLRPDAERTVANQGSLGTGDVNEETGLLLDYLWFEEDGRGMLLFALQGYVQFDLYLNFEDYGSGTFTGTYRVGDPPFPTVDGAFTLQDQL